MSPLVEVQRYEFGAVVAPHSLRLPALGGDPAENVDNLRCFEAVSTSKATLSRLKISTKVKRRIFVPSASTSCMKSIAQL